jgi:hypothetical protein
MPVAIGNGPFLACKPQDVVHLEHLVRRDGVQGGAAAVDGGQEGVGQHAQPGLGHRLASQGAGDARS